MQMRRNWVRVEKSKVLSFTLNHNNWDIKISTPVATLWTDSNNHRKTTIPGLFMVCLPGYWLRQADVVKLPLLSAKFRKQYKHLARTNKLADLRRSGSRKTNSSNSSREEWGHEKICHNIHIIKLLNFFLQPSRRKTPQTPRKVIKAVTFDDDDSPENGKTAERGRQGHQTTIATWLPAPPLVAVRVPRGHCLGTLPHKPREYI